MMYCKENNKVYTVAELKELATNNNMTLEEYTSEAITTKLNVNIRKAVDIWQ